ncbi:prepilin-type N-terminal cleavage/methylation domain-containing protein [Clostridium aestuarii]|uniref:Prepilin-type N-terminal cleavage/methylation domain-containing protein n=2 Tax=Clostridium aestuarii TaxID=338193 RepID=A0ABT4D019_9CLOT|nr:prepilin-type N-terminal cleavage/methylation domain-containing protein [Clostridium aestuarii]
MKNKGYTLLELLIVLGIMGMVMIPVSSFFFSNYRTLNEISGELDLQREGEKAINSIVNEAVSSKGIKQINVYTSDGDEFINDITFTALNNSEIKFSVESNQLYCKKGSSTKQAKAKNVKHIKIEYKAAKIDEAKGISIIVYLETGKNNKVSKKVKGEVYFRNKE